MKTIHLVGCIKRDIMRWVNRNNQGQDLDLTLWFCGISNKTTISKIEHFMNEKGETTFRKWMANEVSASFEIMRFFSKNGMKSRTPKGEQNYNYVYVFKINPAILTDAEKFFS